MLYTISSNPFGWFYPQRWGVPLPRCADQSAAGYWRGTASGFQSPLSAELSSLLHSLLRTPATLVSPDSQLHLFDSGIQYFGWNIVYLMFPIVRCLSWFYYSSLINYNQDYPHTYILIDFCKYNHIIGSFLSGELLAEWVYACWVMIDNIKFQSFGRLHQLILYGKYIKMTFGLLPYQQEVLLNLGFLPIW